MITNKNIIATFHVINDSSWFYRTIQYFKNNFQIVNTDELHTLLMSGRKLRNIMHITVDDGHRSFYDVIYPVLIKQQIPATLFVSPKVILERKNFWFQIDKGLDQEKMVKMIADFIDKPAVIFKGIPYHFILKCLNIEQIQSILDMYYSDAGKASLSPENISVDKLLEVDHSGLITIGAHSLNHPILKNENDVVARFEISKSITELEKILGHPIHYFAYPNGLPDLDFGSREISILKELGIRLAFSGEFRGISGNDNVYSLPRMGFSVGSPTSIAMKIMSGKYWTSLKAMYGISEKKIRDQITALISSQ